MVLYLLVCLWGIVDSFLHSTPYYMGLSLLSPLFLLIPPLFWRITRLKLRIWFLWPSICLAFLHLWLELPFADYGRFPFYDKAVHTLSGVLFGLLGVTFYYLMKKIVLSSPEDGIFADYFAVSFACTIGMLWEYGNILWTLSFIPIPSMCWPPVSTTRCRIWSSAWSDLCLFYFPYGAITAKARRDRLCSFFWTFMNWI